MCVDGLGSRTDRQAVGRSSKLEKSGEPRRHPETAVEDNRPVVPNRLLNPSGQWMCMAVKVLSAAAGQIMVAHMKLILKRFQKCEINYKFLLCNSPGCWRKAMTSTQEKGRRYEEVSYRAKSIVLGQRANQPAS